MLEVLAEILEGILEGVWKWFSRFEEELGIVGWLFVLWPYEYLLYV